MRGTYGFSIAAIFGTLAFVFGAFKQWAMPLVILLTIAVAVAAFLLTYFLESLIYKGFDTAVDKMTDAMSKRRGDDDQS